MRGRDFAFIIIRQISLIKNFAFFENVGTRISSFRT